MAVATLTRDNSRSRPPRISLRSVLGLAAGFAGVVLTGVLLAGRFDWSGPNRRFAERGWALSLYLCLIVVPVCYGLMRRSARPQWATKATIAVFVLLTVPYRWVGLDRLFYYEGRTTPYFDPPDDVPFPETAFLPGRWSTFPYDLPLFGAAALGTIGVTVFLCRRRARQQRSGRRVALVGLGTLAVLLQSFLHAGVRGPYAYMTHYQGSVRPDLWYTASHFRDGSGVVIGDQPVFSAIEQYFHGVAVDPENLLIRRPAGFYMASQFSYFINSYYAWMLLNVLCWVAATAAGYGFVRRLSGERVAAIFAALVATGCGFAAFVGTSGMYLMGYATPLFALYLLEKILVDHKPGRRDFLLYAGAVSLCALTYDLTIVFPVLFAYGIARKVPWRSLLVSLVGAYALYRGFLFLYTYVLDLSVVNANAVQSVEAARRVKEVIRTPSEWPAAVAEALSAYAVMTWRMFFYVPVLLALGGLWRLRDRAQQVLVGGLILSTFATVAFLRVGDQLIGWMPRFTYAAYPAVYLLAAHTLHRMVEIGAQARSDPPSGVVTALARRSAPMLAGALMLTMVLLTNIDSFGHPKLYYEALEGTKMGTALYVKAPGVIVAEPQR
ncbi:MAG: hypothetical protein ACKV2O_21060 [Acidimicrobiales bacterium]